MLGTRRVGKLLMLGMNSSTFTGGNSCNESLVLQIPFQEVFNPKNLPNIHSQKGLGALGNKKLLL